MSTKIYDGMIAADSNPFTVASKIREVIEPLFFERFEKALRLAERAVGKSWEDVFPGRVGMDVAGMNAPIPADTWGRVESLHKIVAALYTTPLRNDCELDFGYKVILLPNGRGKTHRALVLLFSERLGPQMRKALTTLEVTHEYGYWDNTDGPEELSDEQWAQREKAWRKLDVPDEDGLIISMPSRMSTWLAVVNA